MMETPFMAGAVCNLRPARQYNALFIGASTWQPQRHSATVHGAVPLDREA